MYICDCVCVCVCLFVFACFLRSSLCLFERIRVYACAFACASVCLRACVERLRAFVYASMSERVHFFLVSQAL